ncbi:MAG: response regulator [Lentisphaerae bacterium]|nr:response regulator [Lentisphaerota bacterium]
MILVVDDDAGIAKLLRTALEVEGFQVLTAGDGVEAYRLVRSPACKCLVLDVKMPRINGVELLLLMQAENIRVPVIVMAGSGDYHEREMKQFTNVVKFLPKPFDLDVMVKAIRHHARR